MSDSIDPDNPHHYENTKVVPGFIVDPTMLQKGKQHWQAQRARWAEQERAEAEAQVRAQVNAYANAQAQARAQAQTAQSASNPQGLAAKQAQQQAAAGQNAA